MASVVVFGILQWGFGCVVVSGGMVVGVVGVAVYVSGMVLLYQLIFSNHCRLFCLELCLTLLALLLCEAPLVPLLNAPLGILPLV